MCKLSLVGVLLFLFSSCVFAQGRVIKTGIGAESNEESQQVADLVKSKIGSGLRYSLATKDLEIIVGIGCVPMDGKNLACTESINYMPSGYLGLSEFMTSTIATGYRQSVADALYNTIVTSTTDEALAESEKLIKGATQKFVDLGYDAGYKAGQRNCPPTAPKEKD